MLWSCFEQKNLKVLITFLLWLLNPIFIVEKSCSAALQMSAIEAPRAKAQEEATPLIECALTPRGHGKRRA